MRRDRGICHEQLGQPYPAIDDYRTYLAAAPDAQDADAIRERLGKLEQDTLGYSSASPDAPGDVEGGASAAAASRPGVAASGSATSRGDEMDYLEREDDPLETPLRHAEGLVGGAVLLLHKWDLARPDRCLHRPARARARRSPIAALGPNASACRFGLVRAAGRGASRGGVRTFQFHGVDFAIVSGLSSQIAVELRFPFDAEYDNQFLVSPGLGYEHLVVQPGVQPVSGSVGGFVPRVRLAWRHLLAPSAAVDLGLDGGAVNFFAYSAFPFDSSNPTTFFVGLNVAIVWAL